MDLSVEGASKFRVGDWLRAITLAAIVTVCLGILAAMSYPRLSGAIVLLGWPVLTYGMVTYNRRSAAERPQRIQEAYQRAAARALKGLPHSLAEALKPPAERLCLNILSYEGAFQNRRLSPGKIEVLLRGLLSYWVFDRSHQLQISNLLTRGESGEATFPVPLYRLHADVANSIENVLYTIRQHSSPDAALAYGYPFYNYPFKRVALTLYRNWAKVNGFNPDRGEEPPKKGKGIHPQDLKDKISAEELIRRFLGGTPFADFLHTKVAVSIPHRSRFEHAHIVAGTGHGKTQLLQYLILNDLPHVAAGTRSVIVQDSQGDLIGNILSLASVGAMADRVVVIDPNVYTPALNLFDVGLRRLKGYNISERERDRVLNGAIELYKYLFGALLGAELTQRQGVIFEYLARLMMVVPGATIDTLIDFMQQPQKTRPYIEKLDETSQRFFATEFFSSKYDATRGQIATRLWGVNSKTALARMFASEFNRLDLAVHMNSGSLILINTAKDLLKQEGCEIFGRFFIALIAQAIQERTLIDQDKRLDTFLYIDEAHEYFDTSMKILFEQARKHQVGVVIAHQNLIGQFDRELREAVMGNAAIKLVGGLSGQDARRFADNMGCEPEFLQGMRKYQDSSEFACYVRNATEHAIPLTVPFFRMEHQPKMTASGLASLIEQNRRRYGATNEHSPDKPKADDSPLGDPELL